MDKDMSQNDHDQNATLSRLDERTRSIQDSLNEMKNDFKSFKDEIRNQMNDFDERYITRKEYDADQKPIKQIVYGVVGLILSTIVGAVIAAFIVKPF